MVVFSFELETRAYSGPVLLGVNDIDPRSPNTLLIPGNCTCEPPPYCAPGLWPFFINGTWRVFEEIKKPDELFFTEFDNY